MDHSGHGMESMMPTTTAAMGAMPSSTGMASMDMGMGGCKISVSGAEWFEAAHQLISRLDDVELVHYRLMYVFVSLRPFHADGMTETIARRLLIERC
jgi:hypothetical protein